MPNLNKDFSAAYATIDSIFMLFLIIAPVALFGSAALNLDGIDSLSNRTNSTGPAFVSKGSGNTMEHAETVTCVAVSCF